LISEERTVAEARTFAEARPFSVCLASDRGFRILSGGTGQV